MKIISAEFIKSAVEPSQYPKTPYPEVAFIGKSNVGKSSLINCLVNHRKLAHTSSTPGKTRLLNFFLINEQFIFVDLPGYGFAHVSKETKKGWKPMIENYLIARENLCLVIVIFDARRDPSSEDVSLLGWLHSYEKDFFVVLSKSDKLSASKRKSSLLRLAAGLGISGDKLIPFSAVTGEGKGDILMEIEKRVR